MIDEGLQGVLDTVRAIWDRDERVQAEHGVECMDICEDVSLWCGTPDRVRAFVAALGAELGPAGPSRFGNPEAGETTAWATLPSGAVLGSVDDARHPDGRLAFTATNAIIRPILERLYPDGPPPGPEEEEDASVRVGHHEARIRDRFGLVVVDANEEGTAFEGTGEQVQALVDWLGARIGWHREYRAEWHTVALPDGTDLGQVDASPHFPLWVYSALNEPLARLLEARPETELEEEARLDRERALEAEGN